jgi:hypothetical protein
MGEILVPIQGQPGLFRQVDEATGQPVSNSVVNIRDFREGDKYDTVALPTGQITAGTEFSFFNNLQGKVQGVDTNLRTPSKLSAGESMVLDRIGVHVRLGTGVAFPPPQDVKSILENSFYRLKINDILQDEGPAIKFPSGYGMYGQTNENGQGIVTNGVPATASTARLVKKQLLNQNHELDGKLIFNQRQWLTSTVLGPAPFTAGDELVVITVQTSTNPPRDAAVLVTNFLHGLIRSAVSKG